MILISLFLLLLTIVMLLFQNISVTFYKDEEIELIIDVFPIAFILSKFNEKKSDAPPPATAIIKLVRRVLRHSKVDLFTAPFIPKNDSAIEYGRLHALLSPAVTILSTFTQTLRISDKAIDATNKRTLEVKATLRLYELIIPILIFTHDLKKWRKENGKQHRRNDKSIA